MGCEGRIKGCLPSASAFQRVAMMNFGWCQNRNAAVAMLVVVPDEERRAEVPCSSEAEKRRREFRLIACGFEERFFARVIVGNMRS